MATSTIANLVELLETLPPELQERTVEHLREYIANLQDEARWDASFSRTETALIAAAKRAKQERAAGKATAMDYDRL
ncbi:hypothetical protein [Oscillatoria sp. FACHB-1406]|uniref:hypothetical protein n=1 Tax=Oscillatoria sp. FACHB-1406 TaxID=2692846 RepID=UPI001683F330|nr:hypothetical protein [Oscillatoria sp. FACHB-1406]MBD2578991.1 hypothetical protein [Oscillatoria sp. FACHB-1406]